MSTHQQPSPTASTTSPAQSPTPAATFCSDADLLLWEPNLARFAWPAATCVERGQARITGRQIVCPTPARSLPDPSFTFARPGDLIHLRSRSFNITRVLQFAPSNGRITLNDPPALSHRAELSAEHTDVEFRIIRFDHARQIAAQTVLNLCGIDPGHQVADASRLRRPTVLATLEIIHSLLASAGGEQASDLIVRQQLYARLFRRALKMLRVEIMEPPAVSGFRFASPDLRSLRCA